MKKYLIAMLAAVFMALAPVAVQAECYPIETAKSDVAKWDKNAVWEYLMEGQKYDAIVSWLETQNKSIEKIDGIIITHATGSPGSMVEGPMVMFALSPDGLCAEMATFHVMSKLQFDKIVGQEV